jgi:hypothetical protein
MKQIIRLTEGDLHRIVKESVNRIIREWDSPLDNVRNNKSKPVGQIRNFDPNRSYTRLNGMYVDNQKVMEIAKKKLLSIISKPFEVRISNFDENDYAYFYGETPDGWWFEADDIPVDLVIDSYSYYSPATRWDPEEWGGTEGGVESIDEPGYIIFCPPGGTYKDWQKIQFDNQIRDLFVKNAEPNEDSVGEALSDKEAYQRDMEAGRRDEYNDMLRDER